MPDRIKGITIALSGDTSGLSKSIQSVNKDIKDTQSQLRDVERLLKLDPGNTELLEQKQRLLAQSVGDTKDKLDLLNEAEEKMREQMEQSEEVTRDQQEAYENLQREIISTKNYLEEDEQALKDTEDAMRKAESQAGSFSKSLEKVGSTAKNVADKTKGLSIAAGGALAGIGGLAIKAAQTADDLNTTSKQTGLSTDTLQEFKYATDLIDVSYDTFTGSAKKMVSTLRTNEDAFTSLGIATRDAGGEFLSNDEIYWASIEALGAIQNETERDIAAQELFGRSSADLAGLVDDGGAAFRQYAQDAQDMGVILSSDTLDSMNQVNDTLDQLKAQATASFFTAAAPVLEELTPLITEIAEWLGKVLEKIASLDGDTLKIIITILGVVAAISPIASMIATVTSVIQAIIPVIGAVNAVMAANPIGVIIVLIAAITALIIANWDKIKPIFEAMKEKILGALEAIKDGLATFKDKVVGIVQTLRDAIKVPINAMLGFINTLIDGINKIIDNPLTSAVSSLFGASGPKIPHIPLLANGGTVTSGAAIVGEAGPELLTMNGGAATVTPIVNVDTSTIEQQLAGMSAQHGAPINLALNIDGKAFARATYDAQVYESGRRGGRLVTAG